MSCENSPRPTTSSSPRSSNDSSPHSEPPGSVWVGSLHPEVTESILKDHFSGAGPIVSVFINRKSSKIFGFVNFRSLSDAQEAVRLYDGSVLMGLAIKVNLKDSTGPRSSRLSSSSEAEPVSQPGAIWIGSLNSKTNEEDLSQGFQAYSNQITSIRVVRDAHGNSKKFAFVNFASKLDAISAMKAMEGNTIAGNKVKLSLKLPSSSTSRPSTAVSPRPVNPPGPAGNCATDQSRTTSHTRITAEVTVDEGKMTEAFSDEDPLVAHIIFARSRDELISLAKAVKVFVEKKHDKITMTGTRRGIAAVQQWLLSRGSEIKQSFSTETVHFDAVQAVALHNVTVGSSISKLEKSKCVETKWFGKIQQQGLIAKRLITAAGEVKALQLRVRNILEEEVDVVICGVDPSLDTTTGLAKALSKAGGSSIRSQIDDYIKTHGNASEGSAIAIKAGELKCKWLVFAVIPNASCGESAFKYNECDRFRAAISSSLREAARCQATRVAMPALSAGSSHFPIKECAEITVQASALYLESSSSDSISNIDIVLPYDAKLVDEFQAQFSSDGSTIYVRPLMQPPETTFTSSWLYEDDKGQFTNYDTVAAKEVEKMFQGSTKGGAIKINDFHYDVDFTSLTQTNRQTQKVRRIKRVTSADSGTWYYMENDGSYKQYDRESTLAIETARAKGQSRIEIKVNSYTYTIDLAKMEQTNCVTNTTRRIRQDPSASASCKVAKTTMLFKDVNVEVRGQSADVAAAMPQLTKIVNDAITKKTVSIPKSLGASMQPAVDEIAKVYGLRIDWQLATDGPSVAKFEGLKQHVDNAVQDVQEKIIQLQQSSVQSNYSLPTEWEPLSDPKIPELKLVPTSGNEYSHVLTKMRQSMPTVTIIKLERIQNGWLWRKYAEHKERMREKNSGVVNEKELFHGTRSTSPDKIYMCEEGFDMRFCSSGMWGQGCYFAENASYSNGYSYSAGSRKQMFLAKVLTGDAADIPSNGSLRMPPEKTTSRGQTVRYDTVTGYIGRSRVYITYNNDKAYPFYLITYK